MGPIEPAALPSGGELRTSRSRRRRASGSITPLPGTEDILVTQATNTYRLGDATITRIDELRLAAFKFDALYPDGELQALERHRERLGGGLVRCCDRHLHSEHSQLAGQDTRPHDPDRHGHRQ